MLVLFRVLVSRRESEVFVTDDIGGERFDVQKPGVSVSQASPASQQPVYPKVHVTAPRPQVP